MTAQNFVNLISLNLEEGWSIVKQLVDSIEKKSDGEYFIVKEPLKSSLQIYKVGHAENPTPAISEEPEAEENDS